MRHKPKGHDEYELDYLIIAGLCEVGFTYCLGRAKGVAGYEWWTWISGFAVFYVLSAILLAKATQTLPIGTACMDGHWCRWCCACRHSHLP